MKYQVWLTSDTGRYMCIRFDTVAEALYVINNLKEYEDWSFTI